MRLELKARQYAEALFSVAAEVQAEKAVRDSLALINNAPKISPEFRSFLHSKRVSRSDKSKAIQKILGASCHTIVISFIDLLKDENLINLFSHLEKAYSVLYKSSMNVVAVTAYVAKKFSEPDIRELKNSLESSLGKTAELTVNVDKTLIGGIKLRVGNTFLDASIRNQLETMRKALIDA